MQLQNFYAQDVNGNIVPGAVCTLYIAGTTTLATGLQDANGAPLTNPFNANSIGLASVAAPQGVYDLQIVSGLINSKIRIQFIDVAQVSADATSASASAAAASSSAAASAAAAAQTITLTAQFIAPSATNPTTRDNGQPLQIGDRYFNTSTQLENIYRSSGWSANTGALSLSQSSGATQVGAIMPDGSTGNMQSLADLKANLLDLSDTASPTKNSGMIGFNPLLAYSAGSAGGVISSLLNRYIFIMPTGGGVDDASRINAIAASAGAGAKLAFAPGNYSQSVRLTTQTGQEWTVFGGHRSGTFTKIANCDALYVTTMARVFNFNFEGVGSTYTGKGIICEGFDGGVFLSRASAMKGQALSFPGEAGGFSIQVFRGGTIDTTTVAAIDLMGVATVRPIFFEDIWLSDGYMDFTGSGNGVCMNNFRMVTIKHGAGAGLAHLSTGRIGNSTPVVISGGGSTFDGISFAGGVSIVSGVGHRFGPSCDGEITEDSASNSNYFNARGTITNTGWGQTSGVGPSIGNGSLTINYVRTGRSVDYQLSLVAGSTTTFGDGAGSWTFPIPFVSTPNINADGMSGNAFDLSASLDYLVFAQIPSSSSILNFGRNGSGVRQGTPFTWASGDKLVASLTYLVR